MFEVVAARHVVQSHMDPWQLFSISEGDGVSPVDAIFSDKWRVYTTITMEGFIMRSVLEKGTSNAIMRPDRLVNTIESMHIADTATR